MKPSELLSDESKWVKRDYAVNKEGRACPVDSDGAVRFCIRGAMRKTDCYSQKQIDAVSRQIPPQFIGISHFNDDPDTTFEDVRKVLLECGL